MKIWICGACGRMGRAVAAQARAEGVDIAGGVDSRPGEELGFPVYGSFAAAPDTGDAVIDFSTPDALTDVLAYALRNHLPVVLATTGYTEGQLEEIAQAAEKIPVFRSANMSVGIAILRRLAREAAASLGGSFDIEIVEAHHNQKQDAPSGTAKMLYEAVSSAVPYEAKPICGREGAHCKRERQEIGMHALRGGTVAGEHEVCFLGPQERITLRHSAESRSVFAVGALRAAAFLQGKAPGAYDMDDLIAGQAGEKA